jgi:IS5 family transposase
MSRGCSDRTIRRLRRGWAEQGVGRQLLRLTLIAYDKMIGLQLEDLSADGSVTKSPCGGQVSGRSPVDRGKQGTKRSVVGDGDGIPLHLVAARANDHDSPLLEPTLAGVCDMIGPLPDGPGMHLDRGYDSTKTRDLLEILGYDAEIAANGDPPRQRPASDGRSSACTRGSTASASSAAAPTSARSWPSSTSTSPPR